MTKVRDVLFNLVILFLQQLGKLLIFTLTFVANILTYGMMFVTINLVNIVNFVLSFIYKVIVLLYYIIKVFIHLISILPISILNYLRSLSIFGINLVKGLILLCCNNFVNFIRFSYYCYHNFSWVQFRQKYITIKFFWQVSCYIVINSWLNVAKIISFMFAKIVIVLQIILTNEIFLFFFHIFIFLFQIFFYIYNLLISGVYIFLLLVFNTLMFTQSMIVITVFIIKSILFLLISFFTKKFWKLMINKGRNLFLETKQIIIDVAIKLVKFSYNEIIIFIQVAQNILKSLMIVILFYLKRIRLKLSKWFKNNILSLFTLVYMVLVLLFGSIYFLIFHLNVYNKLSEESKNYNFVTRLSEVIILFSNSELLKPVHYNKITFHIKSGESLYDSLKAKNVDPANIVEISQYLKKHFNLRYLRSNWDLQMILVSSKNWQYKKVQNLYIPINNKEELVLDADINYNYIAYKRKKKLSRYIIRREFRIENSIYQSANDAKVPNSVIYLLFKIMSWDIDFQREIKSGDTVEVVYECLYNQNNELVTCDELLFGHLKLSNRNLVFYKYKNEYYHENGESVVKALLKTPLEYANSSRVSSPFGFRLHPILKYTILHKGVDFTGPIGAKIFASGDGVIVKKYRSASYGNYIKIKHNGHLDSAYAHMSKFAKGTYVGKRVKQWDVIGYVGKTGRVTGPHLHYEIFINNKASNPLTVKMPSNKSIPEIDKKDFNLLKTSLNTVIVRIPTKGMLLTSYVRDKDGNIVKDSNQTASTHIDNQVNKVKKIKSSNKLAKQ